jgi:hypothetical protein
MKIIPTLSLVILSIVASPIIALAQSDTSSAKSDVIDPATFAAADTLIETIMPKEGRKELIDSMVRPMIKNISDGILNNPEMQASLPEDPELINILNRFIEKQSELAIIGLDKDLPNMLTAMKRAYARQFSVKELQDAQAFFATPSGKAYMIKATGIMADPDVAKWQRDYMTNSMQETNIQLKVFLDQISTYLAEKNKSSKKRNRS